MEKAAWYWRLPIIRHARYFVTMYRINRHYEIWRMMGAIPWNIDKDYEVADQIWRGEL